MVTEFSFLGDLCKFLFHIQSYYGISEDFEHKALVELSTFIVLLTENRQMLQFIKFCLIKFYDYRLSTLKVTE